MCCVGANDMISRGLGDDRAVCLRRATGDVEVVDAMARSIGRHRSVKKTLFSAPFCGSEIEGKRNEVLSRAAGARRLYICKRAAFIQENVQINAMHCWRASRSSGGDR